MLLSAAEIKDDTSELGIRAPPFRGSFERLSRLGIDQASLALRSLLSRFGQTKASFQWRSLLQTFKISQKFCLAEIRRNAQKFLVASLNS